MTTTKRKKLYLAGASAELELVEAAAVELEASGLFEIVEPWWERIRFVRSRGCTSDADVPDPYMAESARRNEFAISEAEVCVFRCGKAKAFSGGAGYELGLAKALREQRDFLVEGAPLAHTPRIYVVGDHRRFVGIWEPPRPILVATLEEMIALERAR